MQLRIEEPPQGHLISFCYKGGFIGEGYTQLAPGACYTGEQREFTLASTAGEVPVWNSMI